MTIDEPRSQVADDGPAMEGTADSGTADTGTVSAGAAVEEQGPALSVTGAARGLGVAAATLRSWERRYGLAPSLHTKGGHRRYGPSDLARLQVMHRLVHEGVPAAEAARVAIHARVDVGPSAADGPSAAVLATVPSPTPAGMVEEVDGEPGPGDVPERGEVSAGSAGGGRVLPMPRRSRSARGLARAAIALDAPSCRRTIEASLADRGALATWEELVRPVLVAMGERWAQTGRGVEIEHSFSTVVAGALGAHAARLARPRNSRPVLLAGAPDELHDLPLVALAAALADRGIRSHLMGARTPVAALADAVLRLGPAVVYLWSQIGPAEPPELPAIRPAPTLLVGGPGWVVAPEGAVVTHDLADAVGAVRTVIGL